MNRRLLPLMAAELVFGVGLTVFSQPVIIPVAVLFAAAMAFSLRDQGRRIVSVVVFFMLAAFAIGINRGYVCHREYEEIEEYLKDERTYIVEGKLYKKVINENGAAYYLDDAGIGVFSGSGGEPECHRISSGIVYYPPGDTVEVGSIIRAVGKPGKIHEAANDGGFDEREYLLSQGISVKLYGDKILKVKKPIYSLRRLLYNVRCDMLAVYEKSLPGEESGIVSSMTLGDKRSLSDDSKELFSDAGISHILAISGLHISILGMMFLWMLKRLGMPIVMATVLSGCFVLLYGIMAGESVSTIRAVGMFFVLSGAHMIGEAYDIYSAMGFVMLVMVSHEPMCIKSAAFVLSFSAVFGAVYLGGGLSTLFYTGKKKAWEEEHRGDRSEKWELRPHQKLISAVISLAGLQLFSLPVTAYYFYEISIYSLVLNILLVPLASVILVTAFVGGAFGIVFLPAGKIIVSFCHPIIYLYEFCADYSLRLPFARWIIGRPSFVVILIYYLLIISFYKIIKEMSRRKTGFRILIYPLITSVLLFVISFHPSRGFEVDVLSVGQGDGIFVDSGFGERIFIDGGSSSDDEVGKNVILPFLKSRAVRKVDLWFITHMDADHYNGFLKVLEENYPVGGLVLAQSIEKTDMYYELLKICRDKRIPVKYVSTDDIIGFEGGIIDKRQMSIRVLFPGEQSDFSGTNENSLSFVLSYDGFDGVFTGDIGAEQEEYILDNVDDVGEVEFLKSAHHGSKNSNCESWLGRLVPKLTVFSAGKDNSYGHPSRETIERCEKLGLFTLCTIDSGQISMRWKDGSLWVKRFRGESSDNIAM